MAVKCILTGQTPSVLDGVTENVQSQIDNKVNKVTGKGLSTEDYTTTEKTKLSGIEEGAQKNTVTSVAGKTGAVTLAKDDVGLGNVDNTSDANKPISTTTQTALDKKQDKLSDDVYIDSDQVGLRDARGNFPTSFLSIENKENSFLSATYSVSDDAYYGFSAPLAENPSDGQKPNEIYLASAPYADEGYSSNFTTPVSLKNVADPVEETDAANKRWAYNNTKKLLTQSISVKGIFKGDGTGMINAAEETEVMLVDLPTDHVSNISLPTASWTGSDPYTQTITIPGSTANIKVDIQPSEEIYDQLVTDNVGYLAIKNVNGTLTAVAKGGKPSVDLNVQITYNDVSQ